MADQLYPMTRKNTVVLVGHSFIDYNGTPDSYWGTPGNPGVYGSSALTYSKCIFHRANILLGGRFDVISKQGIIGNRTDQIRARFAAAMNINGHVPGYIYLDCHSNNPSNNIPTAKGIEDTHVMIKWANDNNIQVILALDIPRGNGYTQANIQGLIALSNYWRDVATRGNGLIVFDQWSYFANVSSAANAYNGVPLSTTVLSDSIHPNAFGAGLAAAGLAALLDPLIPNHRRHVGGGGDGGTNGDLSVITRNPLLCGTGGFTGTGATGTWADNAFAARLTGSGISGVGSIVTRASLAATYPKTFGDGRQGNVQKIVLDNTTGLVSDIFYMSFSTPSPAISASYAGQGPFVCSSEIAITTSSGTVSALTVGYQAEVTSLGNWFATANYNADASDYLGITTLDGVIKGQPFILPLNLNASGQHFGSVQVGLSAGGGATLYVAEPHVRKVMSSN
jgi:hypothetical protein